MRLSQLRVQNFRSIRDSGPIRIEPLQALIGENNAGKSNILRALQCFLNSGSGGMEINDFNDPESTCIIECEFTDLNKEESKKLRQYLIGEKILLRKELKITFDEAKNKKYIKSEYHGYRAEPRDFWLSIRKIEESNKKITWNELVEKYNLPSYFYTEDGKVTKASYKSGLERYLQENNVEYDPPKLGQTQALGIPQNLLSALPELYLLPAITDYSDEIDRRSSSTVFRRLMSELSDRIMSSDPRHRELEEAINRVKSLLNSSSEEGAPARLDALNGVENHLRDVIKKIMPTVSSIKLEVQVDSPKDIFSRGVSIRLDDGVLTDVLDKGHGMQRSLVFSLLQMLINTKRQTRDRNIILAIEEPELYIHPHCQRLIFRVLKEFSGATDDNIENYGGDQVIYTTHSPAFIEVWNYHRIGLVRKPDLETGTNITQVDKGVLGDPDERKAFKTLTCFGIKHNEVFFSRHAILVEGVEDEIAVIATARELGKIVELPDEIGISIVVAGSKGEIPKFQKVLNAFNIHYSVLLEMDGQNEEHKQNKAIIDLLNGNSVAKIEIGLENLCGLSSHFQDQMHTKLFFSDPININDGLKDKIAALFPN